MFKDYFFYLKRINFKFKFLFNFFYYFFLSFFYKNFVEKLNFFILIYYCLEDFYVQKFPILQTYIKLDRIFILSFFLLYLEKVSLKKKQIVKIDRLNNNLNNLFLDKKVFKIKNLKLKSKFLLFFKFNIFIKFICKQFFIKKTFIKNCLQINLINILNLKNNRNLDFNFKFLILNTFLSKNKLFKLLFNLSIFTICFFIYKKEFIIKNFSLLSLSLSKIFKGFNIKENLGVTFVNDLKITSFFLFSLKFKPKFFKENSFKCKIILNNFKLKLFSKKKKKKDLS